MGSRPPDAGEGGPPPPAGFLAIPPQGKGGGVLVLHAWWGLNETLRAFCTRLAESGYVVFAPDLFHGKVTDQIEEANAQVSAVDAERAKADVAAAVAFLGDDPAVTTRSLAVIGFSFGGYFALDLSCTEPERIRSVVLYYGSGPADFSRSKAEYLGHFAERDQYEPRTEVDKMEAAIRAADRPVTFHHYEGTSHWFAEPDRLDAFDQAAANLAWERTLAFLKRSLGP